MKQYSLIILAGGFGTRIQSVSCGIPKSLLPVGGGLFLEKILDKIFKFDIKNVYLSLCYKPYLFKEYLEKISFQKKIISIIEPGPLGTGGAINYVIKNLKVSSPFFVINGDSLSDINLDHMAAEFVNSNLKAMVGISEVEDVSRYGAVIEQDGKVQSFEEKGVSGSGWINNGHCIIKKEVFDRYSGVFSLEKDLFPTLVENHELGAFKVFNDNFIDMGIPDDYKKLCEKYKELD